jgi:hypothetical protein
VTGAGGLAIAAWYHQASEGLIAATGASHATAHLCAGLGVYLGIQLLLDDRRASGFALGAVFYAELANEALQFAYWGDWRWADTLVDMVATLFWPAAVFAVGKVRRRRWARRRPPVQPVAITARSVPSR